MAGPAVVRRFRAHLRRDDRRERRLAEPGRAVEQHVVERLAALEGGVHRDGERLLDALLSDVFGEPARAQPTLRTPVFLVRSP